MSSNLIVGMNVAAAIGSGLTAGVFFAFSSFIMAAFARLPPEQGIAAMNSISVTVINPAFMIALFGPGLLALILAALSLGSLGTAGGKLVMAAALIYVIGCIGVTMICNVPLNDALAAVEAGTPEASKLWARYLSDWTLWNHVRTVASIVAAVLFTAAGVLEITH